MNPVRASRDLHQAALADFLLSGDDDLLAAVQAGADLDFLANRRANLNPPPINTLGVGAVYKDHGRPLWIGHDRLAGNR